jgi:DNA-directed RNA polymerase specialized sigma24 family protein
MKIEWDVCARIVAQEVRRLRGRLIGGYISPDDLAQELSIAALKSARKHDGRDGEAYVRTSVRNAMRTLHARVYAAKRYPQDRYGRPIGLVSYDDIVQQAIKDPNPEQSFSNRELLQIIATQLPARDRKRLMQFASGEKEIDPEFVRRIAGRVDLSSM